MRVLHVVEATTAGVRRHVFTLASAIDRSRYQIAVACPPVREQAFGDSAFVEDLRCVAIPTFSLPMTRAIRPAADARAFAALLRLLRAERIDLVHAHSSKAGMLGRLAARVLGIASVYTPHGLYFLGQSNPIKRRVFVMLEQLAGQLGDRVVAVSAGERDLIAAAGIVPEHKLVCIENGIEPPVLPNGYNRAAMRASLGANQNILVGTVARMTAQKNPRLFLEAAAALRRNHPSAQFVWCGGGELQPQAEAWAHELGLSDAVRFLGHREDAAEVVAALDVFWLCSGYEGLPTVLLESMALGVPIVATDVVGTRDLLRGQAGLLVPPRVESFVQATSMLVERPRLRESIVDTATRWGTTRWSATQMVRATENLYDAVLAKTLVSTSV